MESSWILVFALWLLAGHSNGFQCMDDNNRPVDWYLIYKIPRFVLSGNSKIREGTAYVHVTSNAANSSWTLSTKDVTMQDAALGNTLSPLYNYTVAERSIWVIYNNYNPGTANAFRSDKGYGKGVLMVDDRKGFWMIHSLLRYPALPKSGFGNQDAKTLRGTYEYPETGKMTGQIFLCISIATNQLDAIGLQFRHSQAIIIRLNVGSPLVGRFPNFKEAVSLRRPNPNLLTHMAEIRSINGYKFRSFAASTAWQKDLWDDLVGRNFDTDLWVSAVHTRDNKASKCNGSFTVENVVTIQIEEAEVEFSTFRDASNWAITAGYDWFCIGELPRSISMATRAGGAVCMRDPKIHAMFHRMVRGIESCPSHSAVPTSRKRKASKSP